MDDKQIHALCLSLPGAKANVQWGADVCFKVGEKMFAVTDLAGAKLTFKCSMEAFEQLIERDGIAPAEYVGRYQWVTVHRADALSDAEIRELVAASYQLVFAKLPTRVRAQIAPPPTREKAKPKAARPRRPT